MKKVPGRGDSTSTEEVMWLRDLLPTYIKNARIATFSYLSYQKGVKTSLREIGEKLLNELQMNRLKLNVNALSVYVAVLMTKIRHLVDLSYSSVIVWVVWSSNRFANLLTCLMSHC